MKATKRFIDGLLEGDYIYDTTNDSDLQQIEKLVKIYARSTKSRAPKNIGLLNTKTYKMIPSVSADGEIDLGLDMRNPRIAKKIRSF